MKSIDLTGKQFGKLTAIEKADFKQGKKTVWKCQCECGNISYVTVTNLTLGNTQTCGCSKKGHTTHGLYYTRQHRIWSQMKDRCYNEKSNVYKYYGGRGITVCDEWKNDFKTFYEWAINNGYADNLSIDRIDVNGNYSPENCRWATDTEQSNNTRKNKYITYNNETHTIAEWAKIKNMSVTTLWSRLNRYGWSIEKSLGGG